MTLSDLETIGGNQYTVSKYVTNDGKEKHGVWMNTKEEASKYNVRAFKGGNGNATTKPGFFVDEYWFPKGTKADDAVDGGEARFAIGSKSVGTPVIDAHEVEAVVAGINARLDIPRVFTFATFADLPQNVQDASKDAGLAQSEFRGDRSHAVSLVAGLSQWHPACHIACTALWAFRSVCCRDCNCRPGRTWWESAPAGS